MSQNAAKGPLAEFLAEVRALVDQRLEAHLATIAHSAPRLAEAMRYSVLGTGKRLRPALVLAASRTLLGRDEDALPFACAVEMIHAYSLIHDDLPAMDDDDLRRGRPTSHRAFGEALAILAGDALHSEAFSCLLAAPLPPAIVVAQARLLAEAAGCKGMVGGQVDDMAADGEAPTEERIRRIHAAKTGALLRAAILGGAWAAGASEADHASLARYGDALGMAFQIADDVLDETASREALGKTPGKDRAQHKMTAVALYGVEGARRRAAAACDEAKAALQSLARGHLLADLADYVVQRTG